MIKKGLDKIKNGKYENRVFLQFFILVMVPLFIMSILSYNIYIRGENEKNNLMLESYGESVMAEYENVLSSIRQYYMDVVSGEDYYWLLEQPAPPYSSYEDVVQAQTLLQGNYFMRKYINEYNFINVRESWVLNNYGMFPYRDLKNRADIDVFLRQQQDIPLDIYWKNRMNEVSPYQGSTKSSNMIDSSGEQLIIKRETSSGDIKSLLMVQLNQIELEMLSQKYKNNGYHVTIISDGKVLIETNQTLTEAYFANGEPSEGTITDINNVDYNIIKKQSVVNNVTYVIGFDTRINKKGASMFFIVALVVVIGFAGLLQLLRVLATAFSKPILMLQKFVEDQDSQIREQFACDLLRGGLVEEKIGDNLKKLEISSFCSYRLLAVICKQEKETKEEKEIQIGEIMEGIPESIKNNSFIAPVILNNIMFFIIGDKNDFEVDNKAALAYKEIKAYTTKMFGSQIASGISQTFHKLIHAKRAYTECLEILYNRSNKYDEVNSSLVLYDDYNTGEFIHNTYDIIIENELVNSIDSCNEEESKRLLELILERMEAKGVIGIERSFYITRLLTAIMTIPAKAGLSLSDVFDSEQYNLINHVSQIYNMKELINYMEEQVIHPIIVRLSQERQSGESDTVKQMIKLIKESKGIITLNECADTLNYHPNYLSKVLIKEKGMSFTDITNGEKLKMAKFMLLTTETPIIEISGQLQYNNVQNFIRFFKNQEGITPSAFRKEHKQ